MIPTIRRLALVLGAALCGVIATASTAAAQILYFPPPQTVTIVVPQPTDPVEITAGAFHTCVRKWNGAIFCWGLDGWYQGNTGPMGISPTNTCWDGQIQDPNHLSIGPATSRPCVDKPQLVSTAPVAGHVVAGDYHTCALSLAGVAYCWGSNSAGQLGNNDVWLADRLTPVQVAGNIVFTSLTGGPSSTCGSGSTGWYCWGQMPYSFISQSAPKLITSSSGYTSVAVGFKFACGVYTVGSYGEDDCIGLDNHGQLGVTDTNASIVVPSWMPRDQYNVPYAPFLLGSSIGYGSDGYPHVRRVAAGFDYQCADVSDGSVQCVGANGKGQLGNASWTGDRSAAMKVSDGGGYALALHGVTAGPDHACALDAAGHAYCWGAGDYGQLGNGISGFGAKSTFAQLVHPTLTFTALAAGQQHTCGIGTDKYVYCWGDNEYGQLGVGYTKTLDVINGSSVTYTPTVRRLAAF